MILYLRKVRDLLKNFMLVQVRHVPRAENSRVDALAKLATTLQEDLSKSTPVEYLAEPSIDLCDVEVAQVGSEPSWMDPIRDYIIDGRLPDDPKEAAKVRTRSARFTNQKGSLYKRGFFTPILKCIAGKDTEYVHAKRSTRRYMQKLHRSSSIARKGLKTGILLAYDTQRCNRPSQEMQDMPGTRQDLRPPIRALDVNHKPLAFPTMGFGHTRTSTPWEGPM